MWTLGKWQQEQYKVPCLSELNYGREGAEEVGWNAVCRIDREVATISQFFCLCANKCQFNWKRVNEILASRSCLMQGWWSAWPWLGFNARVLVFLWPLSVDRPWFAAHLWEDKCNQESMVILMDKEKARGHTIHADEASFQSWKWTFIVQWC